MLRASTLRCSSDTASFKILFSTLVKSDHTESYSMLLLPGREKAVLRCLAYMLLSRPISVVLAKSSFLLFLVVSAPMLDCGELGARRSQESDG